MGTAAPGSMGTARRSRGFIHECRACNETATGPTPEVLWQADRTRVSWRPGHAPTERVFPRSDRASASGSALDRGPGPSRACSSVDRASASEAEGRRSESCRARHEHLYYFVDRDPVLPSRTRLAQQAGQSNPSPSHALIRSQVRTGRLVRVAGVGRAIPTSDKRRGGYLRRSLGAPELWITDYQIHSQWPTLRRSAREARSRGLHQRGVPTRSPPDALGQWRDRPPSAAGHARCPWRFPHETIWCALGCFGEPEG